MQYIIELIMVFIIVCFSYWTGFITGFKTSEYNKANRDLNLYLSGSDLKNMEKQQSIIH